MTDTTSFVTLLQTAWDDYPHGVPLPPIEFTDEEGAWFEAALRPFFAPSYAGGDLREKVIDALWAAGLADVKAKQQASRMGHLCRPDIEALADSILSLIDPATIRRQALEEAAGVDLRPMETAPRDGAYILAQISNAADGRLEYWRGRWFAIRHEGRTPSDYDLGWALFPGFGGVADRHFAGWLPLPAIRSLEEAHKGQQI